MPITVSIPKTLLAAGRARAEAIGMSFSAYMSNADTGLSFREFMQSETDIARRECA